MCDSFPMETADLFQTVRSVGVVVIRYGDSELSALVALLKSDPLVGPVVVVRNPKRGENLATRELSPTFDSIVLDRNRGYSAAANVGRRHEGVASMPFQLILTQDVTLEPETISELVSVLLGDPSIAIAGPALIDEASESAWLGGTRSRIGHVRHNSAPWPLINNAVREVDWIDGAVMLLRTSVVPDFDERFFLYVEDVAVCLAVRPDGRVVVVPNAAATQQSGMTSRPGAHAYLLCRNHLLMSVSRGEPYARSLAIVRSVASAAAQLVRAARSNRRDHLRQAIGTLYGGVDGLRHVTGPPPAMLRRWGDIVIDDE